MNARTRTVYGFAMTALLSLLMTTAAMGAVLILDDPLQGSTSGTREGGQFVTGGWQVTGDYDSIYWHLPYPISRGAAEFYVTGVGSSYAHKTEHFHMYDYTYNNADTVYDGYRNNTYKHFVRKTGADDAARNNSCEILWLIAPEYFESDTSVLSWSASSNYKLRMEWGPEGGSNRLKVYRDSALILNQAIAGNWNPVGHSVRIACSPRRAGEGSEIGARYSYLKVWDLSGPPGAPTVSLPVSGRTLNTRTPLIQWTGESHTHYQVRLNTSNTPDSGVAWDSGQVASTANSTYSGTLSDLTDYYVFVRMANSEGWGDWSAAGYWFRVDTSYVNPGGGRVEVYGNCLQDDGGPFLGLGFTYMRSLQRCKYDRARWLSDLSSMAGKGFNYQRILSMVGWTDLEIAPIGFTNSVGTWIPAWPDYWQQFRDCIDIAYDTYGIRTEITIFADAQNCMPNSSDRYTHMNNVIANLVGREHKVILIEVANEYWQNGFGGSDGMQTVRTFGDYLAARTTIPVAFSSTNGTNETLVGMYGNSSADIATEHFSRDIGSSEGGWLPVRDCWRVADLYPTIPPVSSNEPIGAGSSVATENDPIKLSSAATFAWIANLPMYVYHSRAGVWGDVTFEGSAGFSAYQYLRTILPSDLPNWTRNDGKESSAPFTVYCMGQANKFWTDVGGATNGCHRNIGGIKNNEFVCYPQGILAGGVTLEARRQVTFKAYNPLTGAIVMDITTKNAGQQFTLAQGPGAYIIKGTLGPPDVTPPGPVTSFTATAGDGMNTLLWTNPSNADFTGTRILCKTTGYPTSPTDGTVVMDRANTPGSTDNYAHTGLTGGTKYYYSAFAHDGVPNYSPAVNANATPWESPRLTVSNSAFNSTADGWNIAVWKSGPYSLGTMAWSGTGNPGGSMRSTGIGDSDNEDRGTREGGEIWKVISTANYRNIKVSYDLRVGSLGPEYSGGGVGAGTIDHDLIEEQLMVFYSTDGGANWNEAQWLRRSDLLPYQSYGTRQMDLSGIAACGENPNFALRFRWQFNGNVGTSDYGDLDNIIVTAAAITHTITGRLELGEHAGNITQTPITVELRKHGGSASTRTINRDAQGNFSIAGIEAGTYDIAFKASHWLRKVVRNQQVPQP